jgi:hypothetical protein
MLFSSVGVVAVGSGLFYVAAAIIGFPFWGRHLTPFAPFVVAILGLLLTAEGIMTWRRILLAAGMLGLLLISALHLRFDASRAKDDYRSAVARARVEIAQGGTVWWAANPEVARYYGLFPSSQDPLVLISHEGPLPSTQPTLVILSKTDIYDPQGVLRNWLDTEQFQVTEVFAEFCLFRSQNNASEE